MKNSFISIIVPIYNVENYLKRCIDSILNQTYKNFEIILVDDGSTDGSPQICDNYSNCYSNIIVVHQKNMGLGLARNAGLKKAKGQFIKFIDSDDYIMPDHLNNLYKEMSKHDCDAVLSGHTRVENNRIVENVNVLSGSILNNYDILNDLIPKLCGKKPDKTDNIEMSICMGLFKKKIITDNKIVFKSERNLISEDLIFDLEYYPKCNKISIIDDVGYYYCNNEGTLTTKYRKDRFIKQVYLEKYVENIVKDLGVYDKSIQRIYNTLISIARYSIKLEVKFSKQNGFKNSISNIKKICNDRYLIDSMKKYDKTNVLLKNRIVNFLIQHKMIYLLYIVMFFKNILNI